MENKSKTKPLLDTTELKNEIGLSKRIIQNLIKEGHLTPIRIGRKFFFAANEVNELYDLHNKAKA